VAIAGASGFVGQALRRSLLPDYDVVGLTRSPTRASMTDADGVSWRYCDLFSMHGVQEALQGVDYAIYLVHSMLPSARLTQANFVDLDLLLADNFARAAEKNGVRQIVYIGGIRPSDNEVSRHLESRLEVEETLSGRATPVTSLRAGIIIGPGGSSMTMMINLVRRLPAMVLPRWTESRSAPIAIDDVVRAVHRCLGHEDTFGQSYEIGGPETMSYRQMLERTSRAMALERWKITVPFFSVYLSRRWVSLVSGASDALVGPLIESLRHSVVPASNPLQDWLVQEAVPFDEALQQSLDAEGRALPNPRRQITPGDQAKLREARTVRSVQRMVLPPQRDATWVAAEYMRWLPRFVWPFLRCRVSDDGVVQFYLRFVNLCLLELTHAPERSEPDRQLFHITGGALVRVSTEYRGRFEFREVLRARAIIAAIHDYQPFLPWYIYNLTQAVVHLWVMRGFGRHLKRVSDEGDHQALSETRSLRPTSDGG
jgi:uncharacterized protein YbjT (DUF2867 family)